MQRIWLLLVITLAALPFSAWAQDAEEPVPGQDEPIGTWRFRTDEPVKVVIVGGSIAAFQGGNFGNFLQEACSSIEVVNIAKARYGGWALKKRFEAQVLKNRNLKLSDPSLEHWVVFQGGLNSVASPERTNRDLLALFEMAHEANMKVVGLTLTPWGSESDSRRWQGTKGLHYQDATRKVVDFVLGRLSPSEALGKYAGDRTAWAPGDLPDVPVDLYDSKLRDADAPLRDAAPLARALSNSRTVKGSLEALSPEQREAEIARLLEQARSLPRWYLRPELHAFDTIHPNKVGHRIIASRICPSLPASWGCACSNLDEGK